MRALSENKKVYFDYQIREKFEAGLVLIGQEVKSIKSGRVSLAGSYLMIKNEEAYLINLHIPPYQPKNTPSDYQADRPRKLLLKKGEIKYLIGKSKEKSLTLVPLKLYTKRGKIKLEFALAKGRRRIDKKELIKKREIEKNIKRELKIRG